MEVGKGRVVQERGKNCGGKWGVNYGGGREKISIGGKETQTGKSPKGEKKASSAARMGTTKDMALQPMPHTQQFEC